MSRLSSITRRIRSSIVWATGTKRAAMSPVAPAVLMPRSNTQTEIPRVTQPPTRPGGFACQSRPPAIAVSAGARVARKCSAHRNGASPATDEYSSQHATSSNCSAAGGTPTRRSAVHTRSAACAAYCSVTKRFRGSSCYTGATACFSSGSGGTSLTRAFHERRECG